MCNNFNEIKITNILPYISYLADSKIHGIGLFALKNICKDQIIWTQDDFNTLKLNKEQWENLQNRTTQKVFENIFIYSYHKNGEYFINIDNSRFMNHSENPNLGYNKEKDYCYALKHISEGEELIINYREFCMPENKEECKICGVCLVKGV